MGWDGYNAMRRYAIRPVTKPFSFTSMGERGTLGRQTLGAREASASVALDTR